MKRIPLHSAELLSLLPISITQVTVRAETCFHLAVKYGQFEAFKVLIEHLVALNREDVLTVLHLAANKKQYEVKSCCPKPRIDIVSAQSVDLLLDDNLGYRGNLEMNCLNKNGVTALDDVLASEGGDKDIEEMLTQAGAVGSEAMQHGDGVVPQPSTNSTVSLSEQDRVRDQPKSPSKRLQRYFKYDRIRDSPTKVRNLLIVISVLIATATYQAVLSPPGGVWQDDYWPDNKNSTSVPSAKQPPRHTAGKSVMATHNLVSYSCSSSPFT